MGRTGPGGDTLECRASFPRRTRFFNLPYTPPMKLLALETSTEYCSVALACGQDVIERGEHVGQRHSELLLPMLDEMLRTAGVAPADLDAIAFGQGPGSFTGLRIACAVTQGFAFAAGIPVVPVGTLLALAEGSGAGRVLCCLDARMNEVYFAAYERAGHQWSTVVEPLVASPSAVPVPDGDSWVACGNGYAVHEVVLYGRHGPHVSRFMPGAFPHARDIVKLAIPLFESGFRIDAADAAPVYIRDKVALKTDERRR